MNNVRCLHFDMKGILPKADFMNTLVPALAGMGVTHLLVEFEDKFPFDAFPAMRHPAAWTKDDFRRFARTCRENGIGIIPLLQCAGHLDYFLKHPEYARFREHGSTYQWCVSDPESLRVWTQMYHEVREVFPDSEYFHIGADEVDTDGCPRCGKNGFRAYTERVRACCETLISEGLTPLLWDDMFRTREIPELDSVLKQSVLCVWQYRKIREEFIRRPVEKEWRVWGASLIESSWRYRGLANPLRQKDNLDDWARLSSKYGLEGNIGTLWGRIQSQTPVNSPLPAALPMAAYWADVMKNGKAGDLNRFLSEFGRNFFGIETFGEASLSFEFRPSRALEFLPEHAARCGSVYEIIRTLAELDELFEYTDSCFESDSALYSTYRAGMAPPKTTVNFTDGVRITRERTAAMKRKLDSVLGKYFDPAILSEFESSRFDGMLAENGFWEQVISSGAAAWNNRQNVHN